MMLEKSMKAFLILEDGSIFKGKAFGHLKETAGEIVFTTAMVGYQEIITDPSYAGQIVMMTYPLVGNAGINLEDMESEKAGLKGFIVREKCDKPNNWRCEMELEGFLKQHKIMGIEGIDTRAVMRILRDKGTMKGIITTRNPYSEGNEPAELTKSQIEQKFDSCVNKNIVKEITRPDKLVIEGASIKSKHVGVIDLGIKNSILNELKNKGYKITVYPAYTPAAEIITDGVDGVFVSTGAGSPLDIPEIVENVKLLIKEKPVFGACLGFQVISLALGCHVEKMKFGHHGCNYPVKDLKNGKVYITNQNNDFAVSCLPGDVEESFRNVNSLTVEGIRHKSLPVFGVQFCPQTADDPCHTGFVFDIFDSLLS